MPPWGVGVCRMKETVHQQERITIPAMKKHFLVTISNDTENLYGPRFACSFFNSTDLHTLTLLHISRLDGNDMNKALMEMWTNPDDHNQISIGARRAIEKSRQLLNGCSFSIDQVITKTVAERYGKVKDILLEGAQGLYDAIILGRRATYAFQWMFEKPADETAHAMIRENCCTSPLWICPELEPGRRNVLLCVDGSADSFRAVDHVGYILADQEQHRVTLFHVENGVNGNADQLFARAAAILNEHGIRDDRIDRQSTWGLTVAGSILGESAKGGYAAVAVGLHGQERGLLKDFNLAGGTTAKLISKIEKAALWCCR